MEGYDDEIERDADADAVAVGADSAFTSWYTLSADTAAPGLLRRRRSYSYSSSLSSSSSLTSTCRRPDGMIIKAKYGTKIMIFGLPSASSLVDLEKNVTERLLELKDGTFRIKYQDDEGDWILITDDDDLQFCMASLRSVDQNTILMLIEAVDRNTILMSDKAFILCELAIFMGFVLQSCSYLAIEGRFITSTVYFLKRLVVRRMTFWVFLHYLCRYPHIISFIARHKSRSKEKLFRILETAPNG